MLYNWHNQARIPHDGWYYKKSMNVFNIVSVLLIISQTSDTRHITVSVLVTL
jgi:hypothetical protein